MEAKYIPLWQYAKKIGKKPEAIYRWVREHRFKEGDVKRVEKTVTRIVIREDAQV